ncbi:histidine kinase [Candidatus Cloacimonadota bacterium]
MEKKDLINPELQMYKWWSQIRWFIVLILFAIGILQVNQVKQMYPILVFVATFLGISILNVLFHMQILKNYTILGAVQIVLDIIFATLVVHFTGGLDSSFVWIYLIAVITASVALEKAGGIIAAMIGSACLLLLILMYNFEWLTPLNGQSVNAEVSVQTIFLISYTGLFTGIAFIASFLSNLLKNVSNILIADNKDLMDKDSVLTEKQRMLVLSKQREEQLEEVVEVAAKIATLDHDINNPLTIISLSVRRILKAAEVYKDEKLEKAGNQMTEALNKINGLLTRFQNLKRLELIQIERKKNEA